MNFAADHIGFVIAAYAVTFVVLSALVVAVVAATRARRAELERLEASDAPRRRRASGAREPEAS